MKGEMMKKNTILHHGFGGQLSGSPCEIGKSDQNTLRPAKHFLLQDKTFPPD